MNQVLSALLKRGVIPYAIAGVVLLAGVSGVAAATGTFSAGTSPSPTPSASASANGQQAAGFPGFPAAGGGDNIVQVVNHRDSASKADGRVQVKQIPGPNVGPKNEAIAYSSCLNCNSLAVALQIDIVRAGSHNVQPLNMARAINYQCTNCITAAVAMQDVVPVADPTQIPKDVSDQVHMMDSELTSVKAGLASGTITFQEALNQVETVIGQFQTLEGSINIKRDTQTAPTTPGASPTASAPASSSPSAGATVSGAPTESPTPSMQPTSSAQPTSSP